MGFISRIKQGIQNDKMAGQVMDKRYPAGWSRQSAMLNEEKEYIKKTLKKKSIFNPKGGTFDVTKEGWVKKQHAKPSVIRTTKSVKK